MGRIASVTSLATKASSRSLRTTGGDVVSIANPLDFARSEGSTHTWDELSLVKDLGDLAISVSGSEFPDAINDGRVPQP